ncbi:hypothetical protein HDZ31DRAFT_34245 [Schizophyllum fasciatum]
MASLQAASASIRSTPASATATHQDATILPPYSPARDAPAYTPAARADERVLLAQPRRNDRDRPPTGHTLHQTGPVSLVLFDQADDATTPVFRQRADVRGTVGIAARLRERVAEVVVRVEGRLELAYTGGSPLTTRTVDDAYTIWSAEAAEGCLCPSEVGFCATLPNGYTAPDGKTYTLPPSFFWVQHGTGSVFVRSYYRIRVLVCERRHGPFGLLAGCRRSLVPFEYRPRTRPVAPFFPLACFFSTVKHMPEEWEETALVVEPYEGSNLCSVQCQLFLPAVKVFALSDKIPFHVLLSGRVDALRAFVPADEVVTSTDTCRKKKAVSTWTSAVRLSLVREVILEVRGARVIRSERIGEGRIWPVPPSAREVEDAGRRAPEECPCENADWEGELACRKDIITGGFTASGLWVQDVILLELTPLVAGTMQSVRKRVPIKLTTEPYTEPD